MDDLNVTTVDTTVADTSAGNESIADTSSVSKTDPKPAPKTPEKQIDDPDAENFDYEGWLKAKNIKSSKSDERVDNVENEEKTEADSAKDSESKKTDEKEAEPKIELKIKVNGEERTITDMNEVKRLAQLGAASNEKFQEAAETRKQVQDLFKTLQTDPAKVFRHETLGKVFKEAAEKYLYDEYMLETMPKEQREGYEAKRELERIKAEQEERQKADQEEYEAAQREHYRQKFTSDIEETLKIGNLPQNPWTIKRTAFYIQQLISSGQQATPRQLAEQVRQDLLNEHKTLIDQTTDPDQLIEMIGKENVDRIRKHNLAKMKQTDSKPKITDKGTNSNDSRPTQVKKYRSAGELMDSIMG